jgi:hypothetical protein
MTHASLFSGIGGFDLAAEWMGWENLFHCEWNPFGQRVLKHHFPNSISYNDITKTDFSIHRGQVDILTGGFPCQPYSSAGKRLGKADERHLWPEMLRTIKEVKPTWIVGENVLGIVKWGGDWYSRRCKLTWKIRGTKYKRIYFQLVAKTHHIKENELGLLPTPNCTRINIPTMEEVKKRKEIYGGKTRGMYLTHTIAMGLLPTPLASEGTKLTGSPTENQMSLTKLARQGMLPTPTLQEHKNSTFPQSQMKRNHIVGHLLREGISVGSHLNPQFVEEMMGFPERWTELPFLSGEMNH